MREKLQRGGGGTAVAAVQGSLRQKRANLGQAALRPLFHFHPESPGVVLKLIPVPITLTCLDVVGKQTAAGAKSLQMIKE